MNILFVCSGNTCRSPMAQALLRKAWEEHQDKDTGETIEVLSAGIFALPGQPPCPEAVETMLEYDLDISGHRSRIVNISLFTQADLILTMTRSQCCTLRDQYPAQRNRIYSLAEFAGHGFEDIEDPFGMGLDMYKKSAAQLSTYIKKVLIRFEQV